MPIASNDELLAFLSAPSRQGLVVNKATIATQGAGGYSSLWRATGTPAQAAIPAAAAVCNKTLLGALINFTNASGNDARSVAKRVYLASLALAFGNAASNIEIHDRLAHMGGLNGTTTTAQTVGVDVSGAGSNLAERVDQVGYTNAQWWLEIYTAIGVTGVTATVTYTNAAGTTGRTTTVGLGGASPLNQAGRLFPIIGSGGEFIKSIQSITHATTGTAGSYGITCTQAIGVPLQFPVANKAELYDWSTLALPYVANDACLMMLMLCSTTSTGNVAGGITLGTA